MLGVSVLTLSYEEEDTCMTCEEEDTCMSYVLVVSVLTLSCEEEDTCMSYVLVVSVLTLSCGFVASLPTKGPKKISTKKQEYSADYYYLAVLVLPYLLRTY